MRTPLALLFGVGLGVAAAIYLAARDELDRHDPAPATADMPPEGAGGPPRPGGDGAVA